MDQADVEQARLDLIRIAFGATLLLRNVSNLSTALDLKNPTVIAATALASLIV